MMFYRNLLLIALLFFAIPALSQQDVAFHIATHLFPGKKIIKLKRDFFDPYLWVLSANNEVYRVNSIDYSMVDYTATFAPYSNLQFIDIAGKSMDTVFLATNAAHVVQLASGKLTLLGTANNITSIVSSVGIDFSGESGGLQTPSNGLFIGTAGGCLNYDIATGKAKVAVINGASHSFIFEATYRRNTVSGINPQWTDPATNLTYYGLGSFDTTTLYGSEAWTGPNFGNHLNSALDVPSAFDYNSWLFNGLNVFWGTEQGLFQSVWTNQQSGIPASAQYLNGIQVNKVTDIFGLTSFGYPFTYGFTPGLVKENLLIGTKQGLYFSSSILGNYTKQNGFSYFLRKFSLIHFDDLGSIPVNDIYINTTITTYPVCEDGAWLATDDGVYYVKPDYGVYFPSAGLKAIGFQQPGINSDTLEVCEGTNAIAAVNNLDYAGNSFQWYKDGAQIRGQVGQSLMITGTGDYYVLLYDPCSGLHAQSNHLTVNVISAPVFTFNYPDKIQQCTSTPLTLQTTDNPGYTYRWYTNGVLNGTTTSSYTVTQTGKYKVEVSACTNSWVPSKEVEVDLVTLPMPQVTSDKAIYCAEDIAVLTEDAPTDASYTINWYRDGTLLPADNNLTNIKETTPGSYTVMLSSMISTCTQTSAALPLAFTPAPVFTFNYPGQLQYCVGTPLTLLTTGSAGYQYRWYKDGTLNGITTASLPVTDNGKYKVEVSSCAGSWVPSKEVQVVFVKVAIPVISTDKPAYCTGDNAVLSLAQTVDPDYIIQWYKDNVAVPNSTNQSSIITNMAGNYTASLTYNSSNTNGSFCSQSSAVQAITFNPLPTASIEKTINTTICDGQTISLKANYNGGRVAWSTGETTDQINVTQAGTYTANVTSAAGCQSTASIDISFLPNPVFKVNDTSICTYKKQVVTLTAPAGFAQYAWNGQTGNQTYQVSQPQTVSLTVTDANGCQATQQIRVADQCPTIYIPNTFTPNGDGINDTWVIEGLDNDPSSKVKVFTRNGALIFNSIGYGTPWNGEYKGKKLPAGAYYYIDTAKNGTQEFSGSLTIIY